MVKPGMFISDRYEIIEKVGSGGMADVYRAMCHRLNRYVAIKILKPEFSADTSLVTKFRAEAQSAAGLSHPNIVSVYDVGDDGDLHYIVMELVEGITLKKFIERKGKLEIKEAIGITIQIAQGMEAAHDNHIVHRDIKPQNIIISREGKVKVADFGIAKAATTNTVVTQNAVGSVHYLSPEQARGGYSDEKSDIYSLGVTMYEMLCGKVPFAGDNTVSVALSHIQYEPVPVKEVNPAVPYSVDKIVQKCMQKRPENRYLSASELIMDLKRSVMNPEGDFVQINTGIVSDSPTKNMTKDELAVIKSAAAVKAPITRYEQKQNAKILREEEEELDGGDSKWDKLLFFVVVAVILTFMGAVIYVVLNFMKGFNIGNVVPSPTPTVEATKILGTATPEPTKRVDVETTRLQNVVGRMLDDAKEVLKRQSDKFTILDGDTEYSDIYPAGMVIAQYPLPDADVCLDEVIKLTISVGAEAIVVPDYTLWNYADAKIAAENDFKVRIEFEANNDIESNRVIRTIPERNDMLERGQELVLVVSRGDALEYVPNVIGYTLEAATQMLTDKKFVIGEVTYAGSTNFSEGLVFYQSETPGNSVPVGATIYLQVSSGKVTPTPTPTPVPTATPTPVATPTPTPLPTPTKSAAKYLDITVIIPNNPLEPGASGVWIKVQKDGIDLFDNDNVSSDYKCTYGDFADGTFTFTVKKSSFPQLSAGTIQVDLLTGGWVQGTYTATVTER